MIYPIRLYGDPVLRKTASPVTSFGSELVRLAQDMIETMYDANGIGLAAPQIGIPKRLFIAAETRREEREDNDAPPPETVAEKRQRWGVVQEHVMINPEVTVLAGEQLGVDGCLSLPGLYVEDMTRPLRVRIRYQDVGGAWHEQVAEGHFAWVIQHEYDHLEGLFFFDRLPETQRRSFLETHRKDIAQMQRDAKAFLKAHPDAPLPLL